MPDSFLTKPLDPRRIDQAFPVVQAAFPDVDVDRWRAYATEMIGAPLPRGSNVIQLPTPRQSGIIVAKLGHGYIHGLFSYTVVPNLWHSRALQVDLMVALDLFDPVAAAECLLVEMERLARVLRCDAIHLALPERLQPETRGRIQEMGHRIEGVRFCKPMTVELAD